MRPATGLLALLLGAIFSLLVPATAVAQEQWLSPTLGGYAFDRFYFEAEKYSDRNNNRIDIHSGPFVIGKISVRF